MSHERAEKKRKGKERILQLKELDVDKIIHPNLDDLKPHPPGQEPGGSKIVVIGKPGTGKSTLISSLLYEKRHIIPYAQVFSGTEDSSGFFSKIVPNVFIYDTLNTDALKSFVYRQKTAMQQHVPNNWGALIVDDCSDNPNMLNTPLWLNFFKNGRHWRYLQIMGLQYALDLKPAIRMSIDGTFILRETNLATQKKLYENYCSSVGGIDSFGDFKDILNSVCTDYTALYINNRTQSNRIEDVLFWYKPDIKAIQDWKFGAPFTWDYDSRRYDPNYEPPFMV